MFVKNGIFKHPYTADNWVGLKMNNVAHKV